MKLYLPTLALVFSLAGCELETSKSDRYVSAKFEAFSSYATHKIEFTDDSGRKHQFDVKYAVHKNDFLIRPSVEIVDNSKVVVRDQFVNTKSSLGDVWINWIISFDSSGRGATGTLSWDGKEFVPESGEPLIFKLGPSGFYLYR